MSRALITVLIFTNLATGYSYYENREAYLNAVSDKTTISERETYGTRCVEWFTETIKVKDDKDAGFFLGRSWRKHGQLVFEVFSDTNLRPEISIERLCTYDKQSGMMFAISDADRDRWMFYE